MNVFNCGTKVDTVLSGVPGIITAVSIRYKNISYEVSYFNNGEYKTCWLNELEFKVTDGKKQDIGFHKPKK